MSTEHKKLVTHNGSFHTDDIFACATLSILMENTGQPYEVVRTRNEELVQQADYVFDVGGVYDVSTNRFDHHQKGGAGVHSNGIEYSSFGLVWEKFGEELTGSNEAKQIIEQRLVSPVDAWDNGISLVENKTDISPYFLQHVFGALTPSWKEEDPIEADKKFFQCVDIAKQILKGEIKNTVDAIEATAKVLEIYHNTDNKKIIVLDNSYPYEYTLKDFPEPLYVVWPRKDATWGVRAFRADPNSFENKKDLPLVWGGLKDTELQKVTGVADAIFCHRALFMAVAQTKEGAIKLAQIAVES